MFQDPRLLGDAYLTSGQYTSIRQSNGVESPTYIQLENAAIAMSKNVATNGGYSTTIYSPPVSYRQDYATNDHHIYAVKTPTKLTNMGQLQGGIYDSNGQVYSESKQEWLYNGRDYGSQYIPNRPDQTPFLPQNSKNPNLGHYAHYVPTAATANLSYHHANKTDQIAARFTVEADGSIQQYNVEQHCMQCHAPLSQSTWRRDGGVTALCDSCANYSKMNGIRGLPQSSSTGPRHSTASSRRVSSSVSKVSIRLTIFLQNRILTLKTRFRVEVDGLVCHVPIATPIPRPSGGETTKGSQCATLVGFTTNFTGYFRT
jgi:hypothetical protein